MESQEIKIFCSYCHSDESLRDELDKHLSFLKRKNSVVWHDRKISAGKEIDLVIKAKLEEADVILLLISSDFLSSFYCYNIELKKALERHEAGNARVIPIILRDCYWEDEPFAKLLFASPDAKALTNSKYWPNIDEGYKAIANELNKVVLEIKKNKELVFKKDSNKQSIVVESTQFKDLDTKEELDNKTLEQAINLLKIETENLSYKSSKDDLIKIEKIRSEVYQYLFVELDEKIKNSQNTRDLIPNVLFDKIYTSEKLDEITKQQIQNIREDKNNYKWYQRSVVVSALTLSLINFKQFDQKKADLLIDFLTDFEDNVWERALTGIVLSLVYHKNKWQRFDSLKKRLTAMQDLGRVQEGLEMIEWVLRNQLYKISISLKDVYSNEFFKDPMNSFLPFYLGNPVLESALDKNLSNIDTEYFLDYIEKMPFIDGYKYKLCLSVEKGSAKFVKLNKEESRKLITSLNASDRLAPYQNLICEYYNFFTYFPKRIIDDLFKNQLTIANTKLKKIILNKFQELKVTGDYLFDKGNYTEAITKFNELYNMDHNNLYVLWKLALSNRLLTKPDYEESLKYHLKYKQLEAKDLANLLEISIRYRELKSYELSVETHLSIKNIYPNNFNNQYELSVCYLKMGKIDLAIELLLKLKENKKFEGKHYNCLGCCYAELEKHEESEKYFRKAVELEPKDNLYLNNLSDCCIELGKSKEALDLALMAYSLDNKDESTLLNLGRIYLIGNIDLDVSRKYFQIALSFNKIPIAYGNLGHLELCLGNEDKALKFYKECIMLMKDVSEFKKRFDIDFKHLRKFNISKEYYGEIKLRILEDYNYSQSLESFE